MHLYQNNYSVEENAVAKYILCCIRDSVDTYGKYQVDRAMQWYLNRLSSIGSSRCALYAKDQNNAKIIIALVHTLNLGYPEVVPVTALTNQDTSQRGFFYNMPSYSRVSCRFIDFVNILKIAKMITINKSVFRKYDQNATKLQDDLNSLARQAGIGPSDPDLFDIFTSVCDGRDYSTYSFMLRRFPERYCENTNIENISRVSYQHAFKVEKPEEYFIYRELFYRTKEYEDAWHLAAEDFQSVSFDSNRTGYEIFRSNLIIERSPRLSSWRSNSIQVIPYKKEDNSLENKHSMNSTKSQKNYERCGDIDPKDYETLDEYEW